MHHLIGIFVSDDIHDSILPTISSSAATTITCSGGSLMPNFRKTEIPWVTKLMPDSSVPHGGESEKKHFTLPW